MSRRFTQILRFTSDHPESIVKLAQEYDSHWASSDVVGYIGQKVLADRDRPGHYIVVAEFAEVDGERTAAEEAKLNDYYNEQAGWWDRLRSVVNEEPEYTNADELYRTGITGNLRTG